VNTPPACPLEFLERLISRLREILYSIDESSLRKNMYAVQEVIDLMANNGLPTPCSLSELKKNMANSVDKPASLRISELLLHLQGDSEGVSDRVILETI
jgi:hypothetical protein